MNEILKIGSWGALFGLALLLTTASFATDKPPRSFPDLTLAQWEEHSFVGNTQYQIVTVDDQQILKATADKTASVLYKEEAINLEDNPYIEWSWKVDSVYKNINERSKAGDDFPARLYVTYQVGFLPWQSVAINYVWSSNQKKDTVWPSPFTDKSMMIAVQSGNEMTGQWITQRRNVAQDFKQLFNIDVTNIQGYAVMVDGDNSGQTGTAYFGHIGFPRMGFTRNQ